MSEKRSSSGDSPNQSVSHENKRSGVLLAICLVVASLSYAAITFGVFTGGLLYFPQGMLFLAVVYLIAAGAGWLVQSASRIARHLGVSRSTLTKANQRHKHRLYIPDLAMVNSVESRRKRPTQ